MFDEFHEPAPFRWNLNAFLQALRSVPEMAQAELAPHPGFKGWWEGHLKTLKEDELLRRFKDGRNFVVHEGALNRRSRVEAGLFRGRRMKLAVSWEVHPDVPSRDVLARIADVFLGSILEEGHSAIGEQLGVRRTWVVEELDPDRDGVSVCHAAWARVSHFVADAHRFAGAYFPTIPESTDEGHDVESVNVLLESDVDPTLHQKWGW